LNTPVAHVVVSPPRPGDRNLPRATPIVVPPVVPPSQNRYPQDQGVRDIEDDIRRNGTSRNRNRGNRRTRRTRRTRSDRNIGRGHRNSGRGHRISNSRQPTVMRSYTENLRIAREQEQQQQQQQQQNLNERVTRAWDTEQTRSDQRNSAHNRIMNQLSRHSNRY
jgi:hypothetical protein